MSDYVMPPGPQCEGARFVPGVGPLNARVVLIGEAPGKEEDRLGQPFVGRAGEVVDKWWRSNNQYRRSIRIDNVYPYRPPDNDLTAIPREELQQWTDDLHRRIAELSDPWVLVPTGNTALKALIGKDKITAWRGSILKYTDLNGRDIKVIPTIHPAAIFRQPSLEKRCRADWVRIFGDAQFREMRLPQREHIIHPSKKLIERLYLLCQTEATHIACDIETPGGLITCVGFSWRPDLSVTIPVDDSEYWPSAADREWALGMVQKFLHLPQPKIFQNGLYDTYWLALYGVTVRNYIYDTMAMHHCLDSTDDHDLAYMASIETREPYWKSEAKDPDEAKKYTRDKNIFWTYNGKDVAVSYELFDKFLAEIRARDLEEFYYEQYTAMLKPLKSTMLNGVRMDDRARRKTLGRLMVECIDLQDKLAELAGRPMHAKKSLSTVKLRHFLYDELKLPKMINRATGETTTNEIALRRLEIKVRSRIIAQKSIIRSQVLTPKVRERATRELSAWQTGIEAIDLIKKHRRAYQLTTFLPDARVDEDSIMRCQYNFTTETGRLSSSKNPTRTGGNLQNIDRELRNIFIPKEGCIFLEIDLSQVEWRIMAARTGDPKMLELARSHPAEFDIHNHNAGIVFHIDPSKVTKEQRYLGKRATHATSYGMMGNKLSELLLLDGYIREPSECQAMIDAYLAEYPAIEQWHSKIRKIINDTRKLTNNWGRTIFFKYEPLADDLYRRAYAYLPQSENAGLLNQYGLIPMYHFLTKNKMRSTIDAQVHDSLLLSVYPQEAYTIAEFLVKSLERPRVYDRTELLVPATLKLGKTWVGDHEFKKLPTKREFNEVAFDIYEKLAA